MERLSISRLVFDTIPQLYEAQDGKYPLRLDIPGETSRVYSLLPLSAKLQRYLEQTLEIWEDVQPLTEGHISQIIEREWIQQKFIVAWLEAHTQLTSWGLILDYFRRLSRRSTENRIIPKTVVIDPGSAPSGAAKLSDESFFKVFDWLGSTYLTYVKVDNQLGIKGFEVISTSDVQELKNYRFYPDFLHPVISTLKSPGSIVIHLSENGSILIADQEGLLASKRGLESWTVYDADHIISSVSEVMKRQLSHGNYTVDPGCVACSLFQILFDISMKRHGGLLVLDDPQNLSQYVIKGIERGAGSALNSIFTHSPFNGLQYSIPEVRKLVELSSVDGALILDLQGSLLQVGSMIVSHPSTLNRFGTREAAAYSAAKNGATSLKVSADGHFTLFFTTPDLTGDEVHRFDFH